MARKPSPKKLAKTKDGRFYREIGKRENGKAPRFYLDFDEVQAGVLVQRLEETWKAVQEKWERDFENQNGEDISTFPCWDETTLRIAQAIAKNKTIVHLEKPDWSDDDEFTVMWLTELQRYFKLIKLELANKEIEKKGIQILTKDYENEKKKIEEKRKSELSELNRMFAYSGPIVGSKESLHEALHAYKKWIEEDHHVNIEGKTTQAGKKQGDRVLRIIRKCKDIPLSEFDATSIENLIKFWAKRPNKPDGGKYAYSVCKNTIWLIKHFLKWLTKSKNYLWKKPVDLDLEEIKIIQDDKPKINPDLYSKSEVEIIWKNCIGFESKLVLLSLNCGFSIQEIGLLDWSDIQDGFIRGIRPKTNVYGEFKLWEITRKALGVPKKEGLVFHTKNGRGLYEPTKGNNISAAIPNAWNRLMKRIQKGHPEFKKLPFHCMRKTAGNFIRKKAGGEIAMVFLRHGHPVPKDKLLDIYTDRDFEKVFSAQEMVFEDLKEILIQPKEEYIPKKLTPEMVRQLMKDIRWGKKTAWLSEKYNVSPTTIREYKKHALGKKKS